MIFFRDPLWTFAVAMAQALFLRGRNFLSKLIAQDLHFDSW